MNQNQEVLLALLKTALFEQELVLPDEVDWEGVLQESKAQAVTALCYTALPKEHAGSFLESAMQSKAHFMRIIYEQDLLLRLLKENHIQACILKGTAAAVNYPDPVCRTMGDIDVLVSGNQFETAKALLSANRYEYTSEYGRHAEYEKNGESIEIHKRYSFDDADLEFLLDGVLDRAVEREIKGHAFPSLPSPENGLILLDHMRHHFMDNGLGLRHLCDWATFVHNEVSDSFWNDSLQLILEKAGLVPFAKAMTKASEIYLGLPGHHAWCDDIGTELTSSVIEQFFAEGNFGYKTEHEDRLALDASRALKEKGFFRGLQYAGMINWKGAQKHAVLRPFAWLYQLFRYMGKGIQYVFRGKRVGKSIAGGKKKAILYKKLGLE